MSADASAPLPLQPNALQVPGASSNDLRKLLVQCNGDMAEALKLANKV